MRIINFAALIAALLFAVVPVPTQAAVPATLSYQGYLTDPASGAPVNAPANDPLKITFSLWDAPTEGNQIYAEEQTVTVTNGIFNAQIGSGSLQRPTFTKLAFDQPYWLELAIGGGIPQILTPRQPLSSSAYALRAALADSAAILSGTVAGSQVTGTLSNATVPGATPWVPASAATQTAASNTGYVANSPTPTAFTLPATPAIGDVVRITSPGIGGFTVVPNAGQTILTSGVARDSARTWWSVASSADANKLVAVDNGGQIYTSFDNGVAWTPRDSARNWRSVASSADGSKLVAGEYPGQIYTSVDSGVTWTARDSARGWFSVASSADGSKLVAVVYDGQVYTSVDSGTTWTARDSARSWYSVASSADGSKLVAVVYNGQIYTSVDSGVTWTARESPRSWSSVASSADGSKLVAGVNGGQIYTSVDSGVSWTARDNVRDWRSVASSADGSKLVAVAPYEQIYTSVDSGMTWAVRDSGREWLSVASSADGSKLVAVAGGGQIYTFNSTLSGGHNALVELIYTGDGHWIISNQRGVVVVNVAASNADITGNVNIAPPGVVDFGSSTRQMLNLYGGGSYGIGIQSAIMYFRVDGSGGFAWYKGGTHNDNIFNPGGGTTLMTLSQTGNLTTAGTVNSSSDRNLKEGFSEVDARSILARVVEMPITSWAYKADPLVRHIGPMAQDFHAAFGLGTDDKHIATVDEGGVALAAIQGLYKIVQEKDAQLQAQAEEIAALKKQAAKISELEQQSARLERLEKLLHVK